MDIGFFLEYEGQVVQLPVNPEKLEVSVDGNNKSTEIIQIGEITLIKKKKLAKISWESWLPYESWWTGIRTKGSFQSADFYVDFITKIREACKPCRLVITGVGLSTLVSIEDFEWWRQGGDHEDTYYSIDLKEYKEFSIAVLAPKASPNPGTTTTQTTTQPVTSVGTTQPEAKANPTPTQITIGCEVILNGTVHYDSYGSKPGKTFTNYRGKVNLINKKGSHPYHVTTPSGGWLGWVLESAVKLA